MGIKRMLLFLLAFLMVFGTLPAAAFGASPDISGHWAESVMQKWIDDGSLSGYGDGVYRPDANITRAEFMALVNRMNGYTELSAGVDAYKDVDSSAWYYNDVSRALAAGYVNGTGADAMTPNGLITRQEAMTMVLKSKGIAAAQDLSVLAGTNDGAGAADWGKAYVAAAIENGLIGGSGGNVTPLARITRAETVTLLDRVKTDTRTYAFAGEFGPASGTQTVKSVVISAPGANLKNTTVTGDLEIAAAVGNGDVTLANVKVNGNLYVNGGGANTIIFNNVDVLGSLVVNKTGGGVRILATGSTNVKLTVLESGAILVERDLTGGGFERVEISAGLTAGQPVVLEGQFTVVENNAANLDLTVNGRVNELISSEDLTVKGTGVIAKLTPADGAVITNETAGTAPAPAVGGSGSGGNGNGNNTGVAVSSVSVEPAALRVQVGGTGAFTATVSPDNASDKTVVWTSSNVSFATVSGGTVTGIAPGTTVITAAADGKTATANVEVVPAYIGAQLSKFDAAAATEEFSTDHPEDTPDKILANGASVDIGGLQNAGGTNAYYAYIKGGADTNTDKQVPLVLTVTDANGAIVKNIAEFDVTFSSDSNSANAAGISNEYIKDDTIASGSALLLLDFKTDAKYSVEVSSRTNTHTPLSLTLHFVPDGAEALDGVSVTGDALVGGTLAAGTVTANGEAVTEGFNYQWLRSRYADEGYEPISGATDANYNPAEDDKGYYIRLKVTGGGQTLYGEALSAAKGPVTSITDEVFAAVRAAYLGSNASANAVTQRLNLIKSVAAYPNATIAWTAEPAGVVDADTGAVTRPADANAWVTLTATLSVGSLKASRTYEIVVLSQGADNVVVDGTDARFKAGYPRSHVENGTIWVEFELNTAAQVYLLVNVVNGNYQTMNPQSVLNGYADAEGDDSWPIWVDASPVFFADADSLVSYDTGVPISGSDGLTYGGEDTVRLSFVLTDRNNRDSNVSKEVVTITYDAATLDALDTEGPESSDEEGVFINKARDKIYVYFNETLDASNVPAANEFTLSSGTVTDVSLHNYGTTGVVRSYAELSVSGIETSADISGLTLSYTGTSLKDNSLQKNPAEAFSGYRVNSAEVKFAGVTVGNDGYTLRVVLKGGFHIDAYNNMEHEWWRDISSDLFDFSWDKQDDYEYIGYNWNFTYSWNTTENVFTFWNIYQDDYEPKGTEITVTAAPDAVLYYDVDDGPVYGPNENALDWAYDRSEKISSNYTLNLTGAQIKPTAPVYSTSDRTLTLDYGSYEVNADYALTDSFSVWVDGVRYKLRGFNIEGSEDAAAKLVIRFDSSDAYLSMIADKIGATSSSVVLEYAGDIHAGHRSSQLTDAGGAFLPAFESMNVTVN
jgi:hypothetical protein